MLRKLSVLLGVVALIATSVASAGFWDSVVRGDFTAAIESAKSGLAQTQADLDAMIATQRAKNQTIMVCWASDGTKLAKLPAVLAFQNGPDGHKLKFPFKDDGKLPGSVEMMKMDGCDIKGPDASVIGADFTWWDQSKAVKYATSYPIAVVHPMLDDALEKHFGAKIAEVSFEDLVGLHGKKWKDVGVTGRLGMATIRVYATDEEKSASGNVVRTALAYEFAAKRGIDPDGMLLRENPEFQDLMKRYSGIDHTHTSTSVLTTSCSADPDACTIYFVYDSNRYKVMEQVFKVKGAYPGISYGWASVPADRRMMITATDPAKRAAAATFIKHMLTPVVQAAIANAETLRPVVNVSVQGPLADYMKETLLTVDPDMDVVRAARAFK